MKFVEVQQQYQTCTLHWHGFKPKLFSGYSNYCLGYCFQINMSVDEPLLSLVEELKKKLKEDDLAALIDASKDDEIDEKELKKLSSTNQWFEWLTNNLLITQGCNILFNIRLYLNLKSS